MNKGEEAEGPLVGSVLDGAYRLTRLIGQGGMGAVYEGVQLRLGKPVAVKLMARELAGNQEALARFRREAEVTSQLGHPHIVQVFDFGTAPSGEPYLVMEYLEGEDLEHRLRRERKMQLGDVVQIVKQVASALAATHAKGIVHRDLKPANIFLIRLDGETDFAKVVDFGISKVKAATTRLTQGSIVMGTPNYMSPEQASGRVDEIDHRADQWALACIAYEMVAGRGPFVGEDIASLLYQVIHQDPPPLVGQGGSPAGDFEPVLRRGLSKKFEDRFPSITTFARAFERAASGRRDVADDRTPTPVMTNVPMPHVASMAATPKGTIAYGSARRGAAHVGPSPPSEGALRPPASPLPTTFSRTAAEIEPAPGVRLRKSWVAAAGGVVLLVIAALLLRGRAITPGSGPSASVGAGTAQAVPSMPPGLRPTIASLPARTEAKRPVDAAPEGPDDAPAKPKRPKRVARAELADPFEERNASETKPRKKAAESESASPASLPLDGKTVKPPASPQAKRRLIEEL